MSQEAETTLRKSLNAIDNMRRRVLVGGLLAVAVTFGAYAYFYYTLRTSNDLGSIVRASVTALTCLIVWAEIAVSLIIVRMTMKILRAIDLALK